MRSEREKARIIYGCKSTERALAFVLNEKEETVAGVGGGGAGKQNSTDLNSKESLCYAEGDHGRMKKDQLRTVFSTRGILLKGHLAICADTCGCHNWAGGRGASGI